MFQLFIGVGSCLGVWCNVTTVEFDNLDDCFRALNSEVANVNDATMRGQYMAVCKPIKQYPAVDE